MPACEGGHRRSTLISSRGLGNQLDTLVSVGCARAVAGHVFLTASLTHLSRSQPASRPLKIRLASNLHPARLVLCVCLEREAEGGRELLHPLLFFLCHTRPIL